MRHLTKIVRAVSVLITKMIRWTTCGVGPDKRNADLDCTEVSIVTGVDGSTNVLSYGRSH